MLLFSHTCSIFENMSKRIYKTKEAAVDNLRKFYSSTSSDKLTTDEAIIAWGRDPLDQEKNRAWFSTLLGHLKYHNLVKPVYSMRNSRRVLDGIRLTNEGCRVLDRAEYNDSHDNNGYSVQKRVDEFDLMKNVADFRKNHPEYEVMFSIKLKE